VILSAARIDSMKGILL